MLNRQSETSFDFSDYKLKKELMGEAGGRKGYTEISQ